MAGLAVETTPSFSVHEHRGVVLARVLDKRFHPTSLIADPGYPTTDQTRDCNSMEM